MCYENTNTKDDRYGEINISPMFFMVKDESHEKGESSVSRKEKVV